jgi:hypothetical protein
MMTARTFVFRRFFGSTMGCADITPGTTGFDVVGSWGWLRVEVPEAS